MIENIWEGARLESGWCILRTAPASTMNLAKTLGEAGFVAWTPVEDQKRRRPRNGGWVERTVPMLPSFVFADAADLPQLAALAMMLEKKQPAFSVFRYAGRIPVITGASLASLREMEAAAAARAEARRVKEEIERNKKHKHPECDLPVGTTVEITKGPYQGQHGTIDKVKRRNAVVRLLGNHYVTVGAWLLRADEAQALQPVTGSAA